MDSLLFFFGEGEQLNTLQMSLRAIVIFFIALLLIRISGRRSFSLHSPLDNIVSILLGSILSRPAVGASPMIPTFIACLLVALMHRFLARWAVQSDALERFMKGNKILLYKDGTFFENNLKRSLVTKEDLFEIVRLKTQQQDALDHIHEIYMERNGEVSLTLKK